MSKAQKEQKIVPVSELKLLEDENGGFSGYGSPFNEVDDYGDIVLPGAYLETIDEFLQSGFNVDSHGWTYAEAVGYPVEAKEDQRGLFFRAAFHSTPDAQQVRQKMKERIAAGKKVFYSIGYYVKESESLSYEDLDERLGDVLTASELEKTKAHAGKTGRIRLLKKIELAEISPVLRPAATGAEATEVKTSKTPEDSKTDAPPAEVTPTTQTTETRPDGERLEVRQAMALAATDDVIDAWKVIASLQSKEGRAISESRRRRIEDLRDSLKSGVEELDALLAETEPKPKEDDEKTAQDDSIWIEEQRARSLKLRMSA